MRNYDAAAHLRRVHFSTRKRGRQADGQGMQKRAGSSGGRWPPLEWLKSNGRLKEIEMEVENPIREEVPTVDEGERNEVINNLDEEEDCFQPAVEMDVNLCQQQLPVPFASAFEWNEPSTLDALNGDSLLTAESATTMEQWPSINTHHPLLPTQPPIQTPHRTYGLGAGPVLASDGIEAYDRESEDSTQTTPDEELLLKVVLIHRVARFKGHWFIDVDYEESLLSRKFFGQLLVSNSRLSELAKTAQFTDGNCQVQWRSDTIPFSGARLPSYCADLIQRLNILCSTQGVVEWHASDCAYTIQGSNERHHLCLENRCQTCANSSAISAFASFSTSWTERMV